MQSIDTSSFDDDFLSGRRLPRNFSKRVIRKFVPESGLSELLLKIDSWVRSEIHEILTPRKRIRENRENVLDAL